jgi:hypothetical protein
MMLELRSKMLWMTLGPRSKKLKIAEVECMTLEPRSKMLWMTLGLRSKPMKTALLYSY